jgi:hypothetical protein
VTYIGAEDVVVTDWLVSTLTSNPTIASLCAHPADNTVKVFADLAPAFDPQGNQYLYPFIVYQQQTTADVSGMGPKARIMISCNMIVRAVTEGSWDSIVPLAAAIDADLEGSTANLTTGTVLGCRRLQQYRMPELHENRIIRHLGGIYSVFAQAI